LAISELGEPPVPFSFIVLGSEGRGEQTLATDQDNAIMYEQVKPDIAESVSEYFLNLGHKVCAGLNEVGFTYCKGNIMAMNPRWCQPYPVWESYFANWIMTPDSKNILDISIFFDFRTVYGDVSFSDNLRAFINRIIENKTSFFYNLIDNTSGFKTFQALTVTVSSDGKSSAELFDIKSTIATMSMFARIYSIYHKLNQVNTISRIELLRDTQIFGNAFTEEILYGYNFLMQLRLKHQIGRITNQLEPDNFINLKTLSENEVMILKKIISQNSTFQSKLNLDFKGIAL